MNLRQRIEAAMHSDATQGAGGLGVCLSVLAGLYGVALWLRKMIYARGGIKTGRLDCLVVSVGNLTLGGTGKTPLTIYLARLMQSYGYRVVVISRGYKGRAEAKGGVVSDGKDVLMPAAECGDEAYMMARTLGAIPILVGRDRYAMGRAAVKRFDPQVILLDDAFQHLRLERDVDIVLLDAKKPFGNGRLFPRGILREPARSLSRAGAIVLTRVADDAMPGLTQVQPYADRKPLFFASHRSLVTHMVRGKNSSPARSMDKNGQIGLDRLNGKRVLLFSGIARNDEFRLTIERTGCRVQDAYYFGDHHSYSSAELEMICRSAVEKRADYIVTTEKDFSRIQKEGLWPVDLVVVGVEIDFSDGAFDRFVGRRLEMLSRKK
jgi:tetraacyldisaccharide 4'-kinase